MKRKSFAEPKHPIKCYECKTLKQVLNVVIPAIKEHRQVSVRRSDTSEVWNVSTTGE